MIIMNYISLVWVFRLICHPRESGGTALTSKLKLDWYKWYIGYV